MERISRQAVAGVLALVGCTWLLASGLAANNEHRAHGKPGRLRARAIVSGPGGIEGVVIFTQRSCAGCPPLPTAPATDKGFRNFPEPTVDIVASITGPPGVLTPGAHGMHIHEAAVCDEAGAFASAGGHFDPGPFGHSAPVDANHPYHMGDIPNLIVKDDGEGLLRHRTSRITLSPGPLSLFDANGSAVIVHANPDRALTNISGASGGPRIACGIIEMVAAVDDDQEEDDDKDR
jgi:superoxide dismutase, Cu-Zn family